MSRIVIVYHSLTGTAHRIAAHMHEALEGSGHEVRLRRVPDLTGGPEVDRPGGAEHREVGHLVEVVDPTDLTWAQGVILGSPVRFGMPSAELLRFIDTTARMSIDGVLEFKAVSAFATACATNGGQSTALAAIHNAVGHWGAVSVTTGSVEPVLLEPDNGNPIGIGNINRNVPGQVPDDTLAASAFLALRTARVAERVAGLQAGGPGAEPAIAVGEGQAS